MAITLYDALNMITLSLPSHIVLVTLARCCALFQPLSSPHSLGSFSPASPLNMFEATCVTETSSTRRNGQMGRFCKGCRKRNTSSFSFGDIQCGFCNCGEFSQESINPINQTQQWASVTELIINWSFLSNKKYILSYHDLKKYLNWLFVTTKSK